MCIHEIPSGARIEDSKEATKVIFNNVVTVLPPCEVPLTAPQAYDGWLEYTSFNYSKGIDSFLGYFTVPQKPQSTPQVLYIFTGLQNVDWIPVVDPEPAVFDIIQPVLQYPGDRGNYWSIKSWYVTLKAGVVVSKEIEVQVGDNIFGNMTRTGPTSWYIGGTSEQNKQTTEITVDKAPLRLQPWAYNTIEGYGVNGCSYEPTGSCHFSKLQLFSQGQQVTPTWTTHISPNPKCHEKPTVESADAVSFSFQ